MMLSSSSPHPVPAASPPSHLLHQVLCGERVCLDQLDLGMNTCEGEGE